MACQVRKPEYIVLGGTVLNKRFHTDLMPHIGCRLQVCICNAAGTKINDLAGRVGL